MKTLIALAAFILLLSACETLSDFYDEWIPPDEISPESLLQENEEPDVYYSSDIDSDIYSLRSNYYKILGAVSYNGPGDDSLKDKISSLCRKKGAKVALYTSQYTDTRTGIISNSYGYVSSYSIRRYDYLVYLFIPMSSSEMRNASRLGIGYRNLNSSDRLSMQRNTGVYISVIYNNSPAYYANLTRGDIIIEANGMRVDNSSDFYYVANSLGAEDTLNIKYVRNGVEYTTQFMPRY